MSVPLAGIRVGITRGEEDARELRTLLVELGATPIEIPTIAIVPPEDEAPLHAVLARLHTFDWIVFTSRNAVNPLFSAPGGMEVSAHTRVAAVGPSTANAVRGHGIEVDCVGEDGTASGLAQALLTHGVAGRRILLPVGNLARDDLQRVFTAGGADVETVVAYRTVPAPPSPGLRQVRGGMVDAILLASPSAFNNLTDMLGTDAPVLRAVQLVCMGPTTAQAVRSHGLEPAAIARERSARGLVTALAALYEMESRT